MNTGKTRMLKTRRELFMRQKSGDVIPVYTYLFVNHLSRKHLILLFEQHHELQVFEDPYQDSQFSFLLADQNFMVGELSSNFEQHTGINSRAIR